MTNPVESKLLEKLTAFGAAYEVFEHPAYFTVEEGREDRAKMAGAHTKNLFLKDKKSRHVLVSAHESTEVDLKSLHRTLDMTGRLSFGSPEKMQALLGVQPGSVTPYGLINAAPEDIFFVLDPRLMAYNVLNFHPLRNTATLSLSRDSFIAFMTHIGFAPLMSNLNAG
jgi:Ala-tRNA(Pro) deacylase